MTRLVCIAAACGLLLVPSGASAFGNHLEFGNPVLDIGADTTGGGGGRWFTGSPRDGYTCGVCHAGGPEVEPVDLDGLPPEGWIPGESYTLVLDLPDSDRRSGALEITDRDGAPVGTLSIPTVLESADQCEPDLGVVEPALFIVVTPDGRQVATGDACGADRLSVVWNTPAEPVTAVLLNAVVVAGDDSGDPFGDSSVVVQRQLAVAGDVELGPRVGSTCAVRPASRGAAGLGLWCAAIACVAWRKVRRPQ